MVPWWAIPIAAWASAAITLVAYAIVKVGADSDYGQIAEDPKADEGEAPE